MATQNTFGLNPFERAVAEYEAQNQPIGLGTEQRATADTRSPGQTPQRATGQLRPPAEYLPLFRDAAQRHRVPEHVLMALAHQESNYKPDAVGTPTQWGRAMGMMQYLGSTAKSLGINPFDPEQAVNAAAKQIRERLDKGYSMEDAVKEHFAGPNRNLWGAKTKQYGIDVLSKARDIYGFNTQFDVPESMPKMAVPGTEIVTDALLRDTHTPQAQAQAEPEYVEHYDDFQPKLTEGGEQEAKESTSYASDLARQIIGGAYKGIGETIRGLGEIPKILGDYTTTPLINKIFGTDYTTSNLLNPVADMPKEYGELLQEGVSQATKDAIEQSTPEGDLFDPSTWTFGKAPSLLGYTALGLDVLGQMLPVVASTAATAGGTALTRYGSTAIIGGAQGGGAAVTETHEIIDELYKKKGGSGKSLLEEQSAYFRELKDKGYSEAEALRRTKDAGSRYAYMLTFPISGAGGIATARLINPAEKILSGSNIGVRIAGRAGLSGLEEGVQEATESIQTRQGINIGIGTDLDVTEDTFGDFILGALGGAGAGVGGGIISRREGRPEGEGEGEGEETPGIEQAPQQQFDDGYTHESTADNVTVRWSEPEAVDTRGPLQRAMDAGEEAAAERRVVVQTPEGIINGFVESYAEDGEGGYSVRVLSDEGQMHLFTHNDPVTIHNEADFIADSEAMAQAQPDGAIDPETGEVLGAPEFVGPTQPEAPSIEEPATAPAEAVVTPEPVDYSQMTVEELDARLEYLGEQARRNNGWDAPLLAERGKVEQAKAQLVEQAQQQAISPRPSEVTTSEGKPLVELYHPREGVHVLVRGDHWNSDRASLPTFNNEGKRNSGGLSSVERDTLRSPLQDGRGTEPASLARADEVIDRQGFEEPTQIPESAFVEEEAVEVTQAEAPAPKKEAYPQGQPVVDAATESGYYLGINKALQSEEGAREIAYKTKHRIYNIDFADVQRIEQVEQTLAGSETEASFPAITVDSRPRFMTSGGYDLQANTIHITDRSSEWSTYDAPYAVTPERTVYHEVGHWGFMNSLTGQERVTIARTLHGDGMRGDLIPGRPGREYPATKFENIDEYVAEMFSNHMRGIPSDERLLPYLEGIANRLTEENKKAIESAIKEAKAIRDGDPDFISKKERLEEERARAVQRTKEGKALFKKEGDAQDFVYKFAFQETHAVEQAPDGRFSVVPQERLADPDTQEARASESEVKQAQPRAVPNQKEMAQAEELSEMIRALGPQYEPAIQETSGGSIYLTVQSYPLNKDGTRSKRRNPTDTGYKARFSDHGSYWGGTISVDPVSGNTLKEALALFEFAVNPKKRPDIDSYSQSVIDPATGEQAYRTVTFNENEWRNGGRDPWRTSALEPRGNVKEQAAEQAPTLTPEETARRDKALLRIDSGRAWFGSKEKADAFIEKSHIADTHTVEQTGAKRFEIVAMPEQAPTAEQAPAPAQEAPQAKPASQEAPATPATREPVTVTRTPGATTFVIDPSATQPEATAKKPVPAKKPAPAKEPSATTEDDAKRSKSIEEKGHPFGDIFKDNKLFTDDKVAAAYKRLQSKLSQLNSGIDPEIIVDGMAIAGAMVESGVRSFSQYAQGMVAGFGDKVKPYLLSFWEGARNYPGVNSEGMTSVEESAKQFKDLLAGADTKTPAIGETVKKPTKRTPKTGRAADRTLVQDWGVDVIDGWTETAQGEGVESDRGLIGGVKDAFLKDARAYMNAVSKELMAQGFTARKNRRGKTEKSVTVNEGGPAVSGEVSLSLRNESTGVNLYSMISASSLRGTVPTTQSGISVMYRASLGDDSGGTSALGVNKWLPPDVSAADFAILLNNEAQAMAARSEQATTTQQEVKENEPRTSEKDTERGDAIPSAEVLPADEGQGRTGELFAELSQRDDGRGDGSQQQDTGRSDENRRADGAGAESQHASQGNRRGGTSERAGTDRSGSDRGQRGTRADDAGRVDRGLLERTRKQDGGPVNAPRDYRIQPGEITRQGSWKVTATRNVEIVELVKRLEAENRQATPEEKALLTRFTGWGASEIANGVFPNQRGEFKPGWEEVGNRLRAAMSDAEYANARRSTQYAHYTSESIIRSIYAGLDRFGFKGGQMLEPGMGIGLFAGLMPDGVFNNTTYTGIEFDTITGAIAKHLYPASNVIIGDYTRTNLPPNYFDAAIGNPPFASTVISNDPEYKQHRFMLHDYFFAKTIDRTRPGGLLVFVTSKGTMDKSRDKARRYLAERANLVGAVRLPQTAFKDNAGTEVVTDVLFLQKKGPGVEDNGVQWLDLKEVKVKGGEATEINQYFADNPEMVLGEHAMTGSMYGPNQYTVEPRKGVDIEQAFSEAVTRLPEGIYSPERGTQGETATVIEKDFNPANRKEGGVYLSDSGKLMQVVDGAGQELTHRINSTGKKIALKPKDNRWLKGYVGLRDALKQAQYDQLNDGDWEASLKELNKAYDAFVKEHGQILSFTQSEREGKDGESIITTRYKNRALWDIDAEGSLVFSLEKIGQDGSITKSPVLTERVLKRPAVPEIKTTQDAMMVSLNQFGRLDIGHVAKLAGISKEEAIDALGNAIYEEPGGEWTTADRYLSGNVVRKLEQARAAADLSPRFIRNVEALVNVQPQPLSPSDITVKLGANWIPATDVTAFVKEVLEENFEVMYSPISGDWAIDGRSRYSGASEWSAGSMSANQILDHLLNSRRITVSRKDSEGKSYVDIVATEEANDIARKMKERFSQWLWTDTARTDRLIDYYNEHFNNYAPRQYDGSHLTLPGVSLKFDLYPHQKRGIWRIIQDGDTYLAHSVGAGKTFTMIAAGMEQKRLGLISKPMYVVPNQMLAQFSREFLELYPAAHIMVADEQNFHTHNRRRFIAQAALNNPDAVIITHSAFSRLGMSEDYTHGFIERQIQELRDALAESSDVLATKRIEGQIESLERRIRSKQDESEKDKVLTFEELGVDYLFIDEMHEYRKLDFATNQTNVRGIDPKGSAMALDLYMKTQYLREKRPGRSLTGASGTPITNTMGELFSVQRFFQPDLLAEDNHSNFDAWAAQYGDTVTDLDQNAAGDYEAITSFSRFQNVPELMRRVRLFMDVLTSASLGELVKRPNVQAGGRQIIVTPSPEGYSDYQKSLQARITAIKERKGRPQKGDDIVLKVISDGRFSAIDMRFVEPSLPSDPKSKLNQIIDDIIEDYHSSANDEYTTNGQKDELKGSSLILFADIGLGEQAAATRGFDMKAWIVKRLTEAGISPKHVAFMRDNKSHSKKERLFADMREGRKRILIGGKDMETGVNVQKRLKYLYHLDSPWFPSSIEQREGRIVRQGNQNQEVVIKAYATKGSYDSTMWGINARKARFIEQAMNGDSSVRALDDVSEASSFQMAAALASGDERYLQLAGLRGDVERLLRLKQAHHDAQGRMRRDKQWAEGDIERKTKIVKETEAAIAKRKPIAAGEFRAKVFNESFDNRNDFSQALFNAFKDFSSKSTEGTRVIGEIGGFNVVYDGRTMGTDYFADVTVDVPGADAFLSYPVSPDMTIAGLATRAANQVNGLDARLQVAKQDIEAAKRKIEQIEGRQGAVFAEEADLIEKTARLNDLEAELEAESADTSKDEPETFSVRADTAPQSEEAKATAAEAALVLTDDPLVKGLIDSGRVVLHKNDSTLPLSVRYRQQSVLGFTDADGKMHLLVENLTPGNITAALYHEVFHGTVENLLGSKKWSSLLTQGQHYMRAARQRKADGRAKAGDFWDKALNRVETAQRKGLATEGRIAEEFLAYAIEEQELAPPGIKKWASNAIGFIKDWASRKLGVQLGDITPGQLRALTKAALKAEAKAQPVTRAQDMSIDDIVSSNQEAMKFSADEKADALNEAIKDLDEELNPIGPARTDYVGRGVRDFRGLRGLYTRFVVHPYTIASLYKDFTPVFQTGVSQHQMRNRIIEQLHPHFAPYQALSNAGKARVNQVLELGRLTSSVYADLELSTGVLNPGYYVAIRHDEQGNPHRVRAKLHAQLSKSGDAIKLEESEIEAYKSMRNLFDEALDLFRDQVLEELGMASFIGFDKASEVMIELAKSLPKSSAERARLENAAEFIADIEQSKRTGYVPFTRYGDYVIAVKERQADIKYSRDDDDGYIADNVPLGLHEHLEKIGAYHDVDNDVWYLDEEQRKSLERENEVTVYSEKVETGLRDMWGRNSEYRVHAKELPVSQIPSVKKAYDRIMAEHVAGDENRTIVAFPTTKKQPDGGIDMQSIDALAEVAMLDKDTWDSVREELLKALQAGGFRKHFFQSSHVPGYSTDFERSTADYLVGLSGYIARRAHNDQWENSIRNVKGEKLAKYANNYRQYVNDPSEEYALLRQTGFFMYIAGNVSSAALNATQVPMLTMPFLTQISSHPAATREVSGAYKDAIQMVSKEATIDLEIFNFNKAPADLRQELIKAKEEGLLLPLQSLEIMGVANRRSVEGRRYQKAYDRTTQVIAMPFTATERLNRLVTFMTAARMAKNPKTQKKIIEVFGKNPMARAMMLNDDGSFNVYGFSEFAVGETQFIMGKLNRPTILRKVGAPIGQFKSFMLQFLEAVFMRWPALQGKEGKKARNLALLSMVVMAGVWGFPGSDDLRQLIEAAYRLTTKKDIDLRDKLRQAVYENSDSMWLTRLVDRGGFAALGMDMSQRVGLGNLMPDVRGEGITGIGYLDAIMAFGGIPLDMVPGRFLRAGLQAGRGDYGGAVTQFMPNFVENARRAYEWKTKGVLTRDQRKMLNPEDVDYSSVALKAIGFQPTPIAELYAGLSAERRSQTALNTLKSHLKGNLTRALAAAARNNNPAKTALLEADIEAAFDAIIQHNEGVQNQEDSIELTNSSIRLMMQRELLGAPGGFGRERKAARDSAERRRQAYGLDRYTE